MASSFACSLLMDDSSDASLLVINVSPFFIVMVMWAFVVKVKKNEETRNVREAGKAWPVHPVALHSCIGNT
jgi:hypothetical protein